MRLTEADHTHVTAAVTAAEAGTDGEIVTVVARRSDPYHDVALQYGVLGMVAMLALLAVLPNIAIAAHARFATSWAAPTPGELLTIALILGTLGFLLVRLIMAYIPLRLALTPGATKTRRVRRQALALFRSAAEQRTVARTGVLLYLSLDEHRAELIADEAIHTRVSNEVWGAAMAALISEVKQGRPGEGMAAAVTQVGAVLSEHFPRSAGDTNELPDRLIEL